MTVDMSEIKGEYQSRAGAASDKLVRRYIRTAGKLEKAAGNDAQASYEEAMKDPKVLKRRQKRLLKLTEADLNSGMEKKGGSNYSTGVNASVDKWAARTQPYIDLADQTAAKLPRRTRDPVANVNNRVIPLVRALHDLKEKSE